MAALLCNPHLNLPLPSSLNIKPNLLSSSFPKYKQFSLSKFTPTKFTPSCASLHSHPSLEISDAQSQPSTITTLRQLCQGHVPDHILNRMEEIGFVTATEVQRQGLPVLFSGRDCVLHAQTGSGKTLTYLLLVYSVVNCQRATVQALIVVPTRELGMQVTKVARILAAKSAETGEEQLRAGTVMALLDGGTLKRHMTWLKAEPPTIIVATVASLCQMLDKHLIDLRAMRVLVIDEIDCMFNSSKQVRSLKKLLTSYSSSHSRQTVFASASIPQHRRFLHDCVQQKWTKSNVIHVHVNPIQPLPTQLHHRYMLCQRNQKYQALLSLLEIDLPESAIVFVNEQSEKSKKAGDMPTTTVLVEFLKGSCGECTHISLIQEEQNFNSRAASLLEIRNRSSYLLLATDLAARGVDLPETTHIYNFDLPRSPVHYLHRAGRTGRKPFSDEKCIVTSLIAPEEHFVLQRFKHELKFHCEEIYL